MIELATPLALGAAGAVAVPLLLHLVRKPPAVVRVGSLRFLPAARPSPRAWIWRDRVLLVLRVLLLILLALALAGVRWRSREPGTVKWALLLPDAALDAPARLEWDRLGAAGFERRMLRPGFPAWSEPKGQVRESVDAWSLLRELDARVAPGSEAIVVGPTTAERFRGPRPILSRLRVTWRSTAAAPAASSAGKAERPRVKVAVRAADNRSEDARYLRAALEAAGAVFDDASPAWSFQLGAVQPRAPAPGVTVVSDAADDAPIHAVNRTFQSGSELIQLRQRTAAPAGVSWLADSGGEPLITVERQGGVTHWRCALRFHPDWSDWPLGNAFPAWWRDQLMPAPPASNIVDPDTAAPAFIPAAAPVRPTLPSAESVDLRQWCWLAAVVLFVSERIWSARRRTA